MQRDKPMWRQARQRARELGLLKKRRFQDPTPVPCGGHADLYVIFPTGEI